MAETREFQAEVKQLLQLMIHSLYSNKEIFLRELISNASDAADKLRFEALKDESLLEGDGDFKVEIDVDPKARTLTLRDNGIGMSRDEVIENIGTIASSGTRRFLDAMAEEGGRDANLIGQFGVGFYASFIVADEVRLRTRRAGSAQGVEWRSRGEGDYELSDIDKPERGTEVILHLREGEDEFLDRNRLRGIIVRYSEHMSLPVRLQKAPDEDESGAPGYDIVNRGTALWARPKSEIKEEEYHDLYRQLAFDPEPPLLWSHNRVEGKLEYTSLLYLPATVPYDLWDRDSRRGLKLYVQRVFIMDDAEKLLPAWLRFVRGVIDSADLPLNVSRELLQSNQVIDKIRTASIKRVLGMIEKLADSEPEKFADFFRNFGAVLKEGVVEDSEHRDTLLGLLRFHSTRSEGEAPEVRLADYVARMPEGQDEIYYLTADSLAMAKASPHLEAFIKHEREVLLLTDRVDEWMVGAVPEFEGRKLRSIARGDIELGGKVEDPAAEGEKARVETLYKDVLERLQTLLAERIASARISQRLTESPACLVAGDNALSRHLERILQQAGEMVPGSKPVLEVNPEHPMLNRLRETLDEDEFADLGHLLYGQAVLAEGAQLEDPAAFVKRLNRLVFRDVESA